MKTFSRDRLPVWILLFAVISLSVSTLIHLLTQYSLQNDDSKAVKVYFADNISDGDQIVIDTFNDMHRGRIEVIPIDLPHIKFNTNLRNELLSRTLRNRNSLIDIFTIDQVWNARFSVWAEDLQQLIPAEELSAVIPEYLENARSRNILASIPYQVDAGVLFYRRDLISALPEADSLMQRLKDSMTWEEFSALKKYFPDHSYLYCFQAMNYEGLSVNFMEMSGPDRTSGLFETGSGLLNPVIVREGSEFMSGLITGRLVPPEVLTFTEQPSYLFALEHDIPFFRGWPSLFRQMESSKYRGLLDVAAVPHRKGDRPASVLGGWNLMINRHSKVKKEAAEFLSFMISADVQKTLFEIDGNLPVLEALYSDNDLLALDPNLGFYHSRLKQGFFRPSDDRYTRLSRALSDTLHSFLGSRYERSRK